MRLPSSDEEGACQGQAEGEITYLPFYAGLLVLRHEFLSLSRLRRQLPHQVEPKERPNPCLPPMMRGSAVGRSPCLPLMIRGGAIGRNPCLSPMIHGSAIDRFPCLPLMMRGSAIGRNSCLPPLMRGGAIGRNLAFL